jgi:hypothetical protein
MKWRVSFASGQGSTFPSQFNACQISLLLAIAQRNTLITLGSTGKALLH